MCEKYNQNWRKGKYPIFLHRNYLFSLGIHMIENIFLTEIYNRKCWQDATRSTRHQFFNVIIRDLQYLLQCKIPSFRHFLAVYWNLIRYREHLKRKKPRIFFQTFKWTAFEPWGKYKYRVIKQNIIRIFKNCFKKWGGAKIKLLQIRFYVVWHSKVAIS